jgi:hypothetical protein
MGTEEWQQKYCPDGLDPEDDSASEQPAKSLPRPHSTGYAARGHGDDERPSSTASA